MGLDGSTFSECLPDRTCLFQPPEHVPRTSDRAQPCIWGPGGLPVWHRAERPEEGKMPKGEKNTFIYIYIPKRFHSECATLNPGGGCS